MTFWEHLEELRGTLLRIVCVAAIATVAAFCFKDELFALVMAPGKLHGFGVQLINTQLTGQFAAHVAVSVYAGLIVSSPYIIYMLFHFISPGLYDSERRIAMKVVTAGSLLFAAGVVLNYFLIFPLTYRFLANYQVSDDVVNTITITSYIDTLATMSLMMGVVFEMPAVCWLLGKIGLLKASVMRHYRKHAVVAMLIIAAVITPTQDVFTLLIVALPMIVLYELSVFLVR